MNWTKWALSPINFVTVAKSRARVYAPSARILARIFMKILLVLDYYLMNISFKFHKDPNFRWGDIELLVTLYNLEVKIVRDFSSWIIAKSKKNILTFWDTFCSQILA